jgi:transporter family protein
MGWISWALLSAVFAALTAIFAKVGVDRIDSDLATLVRTAVVLLLLGPFVLVTGKWSSPFALPPRALGFLVLSAVATGASWVCYFRALQAGPVAQVASLDKLSVVLVALFAVVFLSERPSPLGWLGILLVGTGAVVIAFAASRGGA